MASDLAFVQHVCDQIRDVGDLHHRKMFGEYAIYVGRKVVGLICDNQLFIKPTESGRALLRTPVEARPYPGARPHFLIDEQLEDSELVSALIRVTEGELPEPKAREDPARPRKRPR
jgi:TfoX/Sxy family transcriptional regulator of competence genes